MNFVFYFITSLDFSEGQSLLLAGTKRLLMTRSTFQQCPMKMATMMTARLSLNGALLLLATTSQM
jgi:hypothetical protein